MPQCTDGFLSLLDVVPRVLDCGCEPLDSMLDLLVVVHHCQAEVPVHQHVIEDIQVLERETEVLHSRADIDLDYEEVLRAASDTSIQLVHVVLENP